MELALLTIAGVALALAVTMGLALLKVQREEQARADARVALLRAASSVADPYPPVPTRAEAEFDSGAASDRDLTGSVPTHAMFSSHEASSPWRLRAAIVGALFLIPAAAFLVPAAAPRSEPVRQPLQPAPLELLALAHAREQDGLVISGTVRNPASGSSISGISATASLLGRDGALVAHGRAALQQPTLRPGEAGVFVIKVPAGPGVSRYRIGFRAASGEVLAHADRRAEGASAVQRMTGSTPWVP